MILVKSEYDLNRSNFTKYYTINLATYITLYNTYYFSIYLGLYYISLRGYEKNEMRQGCNHSFDKMA